MLTERQKERAMAIRTAADKLLSAAIENPDAVHDALDLIREWEEAEYFAGDIRKHKGIPYKCVQAHSSIGNPGWAPPATPSLWAQIGNPGEEWPEWIQPIGGHDAYEKGAKVSFNGQHWVSTADANVWKPGVYGWEVAEG